MILANDGSVEIADINMKRKELKDEMRPIQKVKDW